VIPPDPLAASLAAVDEKLAERRAQGDLAGVADAQARRAFVFFEAERYAEADGQMAEAVDLYKEAGDTKGRGETQLARAMILSQLPGRENDTRACLDSAKALGRLAGDVVTEMKARQRITNLSESAGDWKAAETEVTRSSDSTAVWWTRTGTGARSAWPSGTRTPRCRTSSAPSKPPSAWAIRSRR
jgi:hypothetical protein